MSRFFVRFGWLLILGACAGCTSYSIQPWFDTSSRVVERKLLGIWESKEVIIRVGETGDSTVYAISQLAKDGGASNGTATFARLRGKLFMDYTVQGEARCESWEGTLHQIYRVDLGPGLLTLLAPDVDTLEVLVRRAMQEPGAEVAGILVPERGKGAAEEMLMVSTPESLEELLAANATRRGLWREVDRLRLRR